MHLSPIQKLNKAEAFQKRKGAENPGEVWKKGEHERAAILGQLMDGDAYQSYQIFAKQSIAAFNEARSTNGNGKKKRAISNEPQGPRMIKSIGEISEIYGKNIP